ncbi:hypothetical protein DB346_16795 [Verrucomicrobia bacterium LW23]|nr:hypothetical protein DB346_16795 [Verrucomicrobia bacterium LW23]
MQRLPCSCILAILISASASHAAPPPEQPARTTPRPVRVETTKFSAPASSLQKALDDNAIQRRRDNGTSIRISGYLEASAVARPR